MLRWTTSDWTGPFVAVGIPSLGQRGAMWQKTMSHLPGWSVCMLDLPGHGGVEPAPGPFSMADLGSEVAREISRRRHDNTTVVVVGCSIGGAIGLHAIAQSDSGIDALVVVGAAATIGNYATWQDRAAQVREAGASSLRDISRNRWFSDAFLAHHPEEAESALDKLNDIDSESYALCCEALRDFDIRSKLADLTTPVLVISGEGDPVSPPADGKALADGLPGGSFVEVKGVRHLIPLEAPVETARAIEGFAKQLA